MIAESQVRSFYERIHDGCPQPQGQMKNHAIYLEEIANINSASDAENTNQKSKGRQPSLKKQIFHKWKDCQFHDPLTGRKCDEKFQLEMECPDHFFLFGWSRPCKRFS